MSGSKESSQSGPHTEGTELGCTRESGGTNMDPGFLACPCGFSLECCELVQLGLIVRGGRPNLFLI